MSAKTKQKSDKKSSFFDRQRIENALQTTFAVAPQGMTKEQKRAFMSGKAQ